MSKLAAEFVDSDRSRVIVVPGNHDVHWGRARHAMRPINHSSDRLASKALEAKSRVRWDWTGQQAYEIFDSSVYESRFEHFRRFQAEFYAGLDRNPLSHDYGDIFFVEYLDLGLVIVGFSSLHGNDCFCRVGEIDSTSLTSSQRLLAGSNVPVAVAVWHHSISGGPRAHDYMDQRVIHKLIDYGFTVGLHGHQHYPGAVPFELRLPNLTAMTVVGAGSLAAGDGDLPMGEGRQFNLVVIDPNTKSITVHIRAMSASGVFTGSHRDDLGGNTFIRLSLPTSPSRPKGPTILQRIDEAMNAVAIERYEKALDLLNDIGASHSYEIRQIRIEALRGLGRQEELIEFLDPPQSADEAVLGISLLLDIGRLDEAEKRLAPASKWVDGAVLEELGRSIVAKRMLA